jgi:hypothetical protein
VSEAHLAGLRFIAKLRLGSKRGIELTTITIYKPNGDDSVRYMDPNSILIENGTLSFYWTKEITGQKQKIVTTLPFLIQQDMNGSPSDPMAEPLKAFLTS